MTERERFRAALECKPVTGRAPTFELVFFLTMEAFGTVHMSHRRFVQWKQMTEKERDLQRRDVARQYIDICEKYHHSAIYYISPFYNFEDDAATIEYIRELSKEDYFIMLQGDATFSIPGGDRMEEFIFRLADEPEKVLCEAGRGVDNLLANVERYVKRGGLIDGMCMCCDYCYNTNPFLSPSQFSEFITPFLSRQIKGFRDMGLYTVKHTDGNIMPILDQLVQANPHALHSIDPQAGVSLSEVRRLYPNRLCTIGNVNCGLLQTGTEDEVIADARRALREGMDGNWGYVFATSNCVYTGLPLERYELMNRVWAEEGFYK